MWTLQTRMSDEATISTMLLTDSNSLPHDGNRTDPCAPIMDGDAARKIAYISEAYLQPSIFSVAIVTNLLSVIILSGVRMNKVFRTCLLALALCDLGASVFGLTQLLVEVIFYCGNVPEGYFLTPVIVNNALYMVFLMFFSASASTVVFIAFIRNMMYLRPLKSRAFFTQKVVTKACMIIMLVTALMYVPTSLQVIWLSCYKNQTVPYCQQVYHTIPNLKKVANGYLYFNVAVYGPLMILVYIANFICIRVSLSRSASSMTAMTSHGDGAQKKRSDTVSKITKTLSLILILDLICTLPSLIHSIWLVFAPEDKFFGKSDATFEIFDAVAELFLAFKPAYNFWLYVFQRPEFRKRLCQLAHTVGWKCCQWQWCFCHEKCHEMKLGISIHMTSSSSNANGSRKQSTDTTRISPSISRNPVFMVNKM